MFTKAAEVSLFTDFHSCLTVGSVFPQTARLHHRAPFRRPSSVAQIDFQAIRSGWLTCSAANAILVDEFKYRRQSSALCECILQRASPQRLVVGCRKSVIAGACDISRAVLPEFRSAKLKQAEVRTGALLWVKIELDFCHSFHKAGIQTDRIRNSLDLLNWRADRNGSQRIGHDIRWFLPWQMAAGWRPKYERCGLGGVARAEYSLAAKVSCADADCFSFASSMPDSWSCNSGANRSENVAGVAGIMRKVDCCSV